LTDDQWTAIWQAYCSTCELPPDRRIEYLERALKHAELVRVALEMIEDMDRDTRSDSR
jgi:hypothetical protein